MKKFLLSLLTLAAILPMQAAGNAETALSLMENKTVVFAFFAKDNNNTYYTVHSCASQVVKTDGAYYLTNFLGSGERIPIKSDSYGNYIVFNNNASNSTNTQLNINGKQIWWAAAKHPTNEPNRFTNYSTTTTGYLLGTNELSSIVSNWSGTSTSTPVVIRTANQYPGVIYIQGKDPIPYETFMIKVFRYPITFTDPANPEISFIGADNIAPGSSKALQFFNFGGLMFKQQAYSSSKPSNFSGIQTNVTSSSSNTYPTLTFKDEVVIMQKPFTVTKTGGLNAYSFDITMN